MKIKSIEMNNVGGVSNIILDSINPNINIICGENGVGKTNILDAIAACFSQFDKNNIKKKSGCEQGKIKLETDLVEKHQIEIVLNEFKPSSSEYYLSGSHYDAHKNSLLYLKVNRSIDYKKVRSIDSDPDITHRARNNSSGISNDDIKNWLLNRILHSKHEKHLSDTQILNLELAKGCFSILNKDYKYSHLDTSNELFLDTPTGEIYFEYLSSGFKSTIFILLGIIKEIDYRCASDKVAAVDYNGIILIDEIELHLHPEWQGKICSLLKNIFPKVQFFISTHSPHVIQTALQGEVIALERLEDGSVQRRKMPISEYGYQGWTIEEILENIMGMPDLRTKKYKEIKAKFDIALDDRNKVDAQNFYDELDKMLHPNYPLRPLFKMQLDSIGE